MNKITIHAILLISLFLQSCQAIKGIFKAGVWTGILIAAGILILVAIFFIKNKSK